MMKSNFASRAARLLILWGVGFLSLGLSASIGLAGQGYVQPLPPPGAEAFDPDRFETVYDGTAVRDRLTGLVWEKSPDPEFMSWQEASRHCEDMEIGGRKGWRLATFDELASLVDTTVLGSPKLPEAHLFDTGCKFGGCVKSDIYWTATPIEENADYVWGICFCNGSMTHRKKAFENFAWCTLEETPAE